MIDIIFCVIIFLAILRGWRRGLLLALFSVICCLVGLAAAVKLSALVAAHMGSDLKISSRWLPVIAFIFVFIVVALLILILALGVFLPIWDLGTVALRKGG